MDKSHLDSGEWDRAEYLLSFFTFVVNRKILWYEIAQRESYWEILHMIHTFKKSDDSSTGVFSNLVLIFWYSTWRNTLGISPELNWLFRRWILQRSPSPESLRILVSSKTNDMVDSYFILVFGLLLRFPWSHHRQVSSQLRLFASNKESAKRSGKYWWLFTQFLLNCIIILQGTAMLHNEYRILWSSWNTVLNPHSST